MTAPAPACEPIDRRWLDANPLPHPDGETDKNTRGRVLLAGGSASVPAALALTGEAALRAGAGKLKLATVDRAAIPLAMLLPEAAMIALPTDGDGEIAAAAAPILRETMDSVDALILGPGMGDRDCAAALVQGLLDHPREALSIVLDAAAAACAGSCRDLIAAHDGRVVLTPHPGEMAALSGRELEQITADLEEAARATAEQFGAVVVLKAWRTVIAAPDGSLLAYPGGGVGLATGGSGDVLAGIVGGLLARGTPPIVAAAWGVWLHGKAGRACAGQIGSIGFLARELLPHVPRLMER